eukprot:TRINITY_DN3072_c4_g1_i16.p2 TRINITY_DN3072_c4_g1~~TRINITY_DN3072_c4_g1_i16.p2  ORF type:complete len:95 (-),score=10.18 TRINITY_DN3072_c4_g1_i16:79-363(-)
MRLLPATDLDPARERTRDPPGANGPPCTAANPTTPTLPLGGGEEWDEKPAADRRPKAHPRCASGPTNGATESSEGTRLVCRLPLAALTLQTSGF